MKHSSLFPVVALLCGCNLAFDIDGNPYQGPGNPTDMAVDQTVDMTEPDMPDVDMTEPDMPVEDMENDESPDLPPPSPPELMITEIMINTAPIGQAGELGEYIEVKNVSQTASADPRQISFIIHGEQGRTSTIAIPPPATADQLQMYNNLKSIPPGGYFVFVRFVVDQLPLESLVGAGNYFDYGTYGAAASFANSGDRRVELQYLHEQTFLLFDTVRWVNSNLRPSDPTIDTPTLSIVEDVALSVIPRFESANMNDTPASWCAETVRVAGPDSFFGSPGRPANCAE